VISNLKRLAFRLACSRYKGRVLKDVPGAWYTASNPLMWAYAGGGALRRYGNAAEDIDASVANGFKVIELDFARTLDGIPAMTHFFKPEDRDDEWAHVPSSVEFKAKRVNGKYTPLLFDDFVERYIKTDVYFSLDPFYYYCNGKYGEREFRDYVVEHSTKEERKKFILQIYGFKTLCAMNGNNDFGALHYVIVPGNFWKVPYLIPVLTNVGVRSVSFQDTELTSEVKSAIDLLKAANIRISVAGIDTKERCREVFAQGVDCVNTFRLMPSDITMTDL